jgi:ribosomal protein S18 acetylase RimI-like enzyme
LAERLVGYLDDGELTYLLLERPDGLAGAMGAEYDITLGRAWLHGPHVAVGDWNDSAERMLERLLRALPSEVRYLTAYVNTENTRARSFYEARGFRERDTASHEFWLEPSDRIRVVGEGVVNLAEGHRNSFAALYASLFPAAYYSAERVVQMIGRSHNVLVVADGPDVLGFAVASLEVPGSAGEVQFLGVREDHRGRGVGRGLLSSAVDWLLDEAGAVRVALNVDDDLDAARGLYESVGFRLRFSGIGINRAR